MKELIIFKNDNFGEIRTIEINGDIWFVGKDIATALGYENPSVAISKKVDKEDKQFLMIETAGFQNGNVLNKTKTAIINESGLYSLILSSKLESAKEFKHWVTSEVLPSLRKTGSYKVQQPIQKSDRELDILEKQAVAKLEEIKLEKAQFWRELGLETETQSKTYKQICNAYASKELAGDFVLPLPATKKTFSAEDVGKELGISAVKVGRIANYYGLKTDEYGCWNKDKSKYDSSKEVDAFRYYENAISVIAGHKDEVIPRDKKVEKQTDSDLFSA